MPAAAAHAETVDELRMQIETLRNKIAEIERRQAATERQEAASAASAVTAGATKRAQAARLGHFGDARRLRETEDGLILMGHVDRLQAAAKYTF